MVCSCGLSHWLTRIRLGTHSGEVDSIAALGMPPASSTLIINLLVRTAVIGLKLTGWLLKVDSNLKLPWAMLLQIIFPV